tara:strand:- start:2692 stop:3927 length:1236 start_codon:yes stop_codon:yes gene_type:complete
LAKIIPFKGFLPPKSLAKIVSSPPYDVLSSDEARNMVKKNDKSFLRVIKPEVDFSKTEKSSNDFLHYHASNNLKNYISRGTLLQDNNDSLYVYQISMGSHTQTGIVAAVSIKEYNDGLIKKHEFTRPDKEDDRTMHMEKTKANTGPVFLTFKNNGEFNHYLSNIMIREKDIDFEAEDGTKHILWKVADKDFLTSIISYFKKINSLYIADGHHRAASASRLLKMYHSNNPNHIGVEPYNYFLATIFPHDQVKILSYNRLVKDLAGNNEEQFFNKVKEKFYVVKLSDRKEPKKRRNFSMYLNNHWYALKAKANLNSKDSVESLDASILQTHILDPILKISDSRTNDRIDFVGGARGLEELERRCHLDSKVAFALFPVLIDDLLKVADEGKIMPPKSTWFEPKLRSGLIVRLLE